MLTRREVLASSAAALLVGRRSPAQEPAPPPAPADPSRVPGLPPSPLGARSPFVQARRRVNRPGIAGSSLTPLQDLTGTITPADLHFERHHAGVPAIDPARYRLLVHGMVQSPKTFTLEDLKRFPPVSMVRFIECSGNGRTGFQAGSIRPDQTAQDVDGLTSTSEWTGVPLATVFDEVGVRPGATWFLAESTDGARLSRSIPIEKAWEDALLAYGQNGEPLRPEQGFPLRLVLPGWEGNAQVKWLRRIELADQPFMTREETSKYSDPLANGTVRQFSLVMDAKSIITRPSYPEIIPGPGLWPVTGLAWSGRGRITRVDVSVDGGLSWTEARLDEPVLPKCHTRFTHMWHWDGRPAVLMSRAVDETGYVQPSLEELRRVRGRGTAYHENNIRAWRVAANGQVTFGLEDR